MWDPMEVSGAASRTAIMGVLNYTPDSFSDGGRFNAGIDEAVKRIEDMAAAGADIVDIGGQSTRPNAKLVTSEEEAARVVPVIEAARARGCTVAISVDTFRADVARASVAAGANFVNDVSGGLLDPAMLSTVASLHVPVCLMHYRGDPSSMQALANYPGDPMRSVREELSLRVAEALKAGIPRWRLVLDPGIGFAKDAAQSLACLRATRSLSGVCSPAGPDGGYGTGMPFGGFAVLVGASRKSFIGKVIGEPDASSIRRAWGTAAACTAAVEQGAHLVRVHDVREMKDAVAIADAIYPKP